MAFVDLNDAVISQVRQTADIVDFIGQVTPLKPAGKSFKGLCPFHREKTPSFHVDRAKGLFYCFGCGTGGDVFKFLTLAERFTFPEAVEYVANRVGIQLPKKKRDSKESDKEQSLEILEEAATAFHQALGWTPNPADEYLKKRGTSNEIRTRYGFGFAPDSWDYLLTRLGRKYAPERLEKVGLVVPRKSQSGFYDRFRNRLMIPIHSEVGNVIGFGGRSLDGTDPKYLNSPESDTFNKSNLLYNLHRSRDQMRRLDRAILVEGYFDAIALDHAGVPGVVASMGTSLTAAQASILKRQTRRVIISYDGDDAGRNAALRAAPILLSAGLSVQILVANDKEDPDSVIRDRGLEGYMELLGNALDLFEFALAEWTPNASQLSSFEKNEKLEQFLLLLSAVSDPVMRNDAAQRVADGLRLEFDTVWSRLSARPGGRTPRREKAVSAPISTAEKELLRTVLQEGLPAELAARIRPEFFEDAACRSIYELASGSISDGQPLDFSQIATHLRGEAELTRLSELSVGDGSEPSDLQRFEETIRLMERRFIDRRLKDIQIEIREAERVGDQDLERTLSREKMDLSRQYHALK